MARILVINGERAARVNLREMLEADGHEVMEAAEGKDGMWICENHPIDLVVASLGVQGKESIQSICKIRDSFPWSKIIGLSERGIFNRDQLHRLVKGIGLDFILEQPFSGPDLKAAVEKLV